MEERALAGDGNNEPPLNSASPNRQLGLPPEGAEAETYVVQIPRDQIYRVPPPENAQIVESYLRASPQRNQKKCGGSCCWIIALLIALALAIGIFVTIILVSYNPKSPEFALSHIRAFNLHSSDHGHAKHSISPEYEISLNVTNPNKRMDVNFGHGKMTLKFKGFKIANGGYPPTHQGADKEIEVDETLRGTKVALPSEMKKTLIDKHPKSMTLTIEVPIEVTSWVKKLQKEITVTCDFKVDTFAKGTKILSQKCRTDF